MDERLGSILRVVPELFLGVYKTVLYVGAIPSSVVKDAGRDYLINFRDAGYHITVVEAFERNCDLLLEHDSDLFDDIYCTEISDFPLGITYDVVFWWHGPEHVESGVLRATLQHIELLADHCVVLGCPWGVYKVGAINANPYQEHKASIYPAMLQDLGYDKIECIGIEDVPGSNIAAVKYVDR